ncbi:hypothetical protein BDC45DRAFT_500618 [Circinella umbellata]|nr:hypothetical protein BDC45DRAFT_500618 [Circinella umbellata]
MSSNTKVTQFKNDYYIRPACLKDLNRIQEIADVVNISFLSEDGWTTVKAFIACNKDRTTPEDIEKFIHETVTDYPGNYKKRTLLQLAFKHKPKEKQDSIIGVGLIKLMGNEFQRACLIDTTYVDNTNEHGIKYTIGTAHYLAVLPAYQSSGIGDEICYLGWAYAREFMGCRSILGWSLVDGRPEILLYYVKKVGCKIIGVMDYPYRNLMKKNINSSCFVLYHDLLNDNHHKARL